MKKSMVLTGVKLMCSMKWALTIRFALRSRRITSGVSPLTNRTAPSLAFDESHEGVQVYGVLQNGLRYQDVKPAVGELRIEFVWLVDLQTGLPAVGKPRPVYLDSELPGQDQGMSVSGAHVQEAKIGAAPAESDEPLKDGKVA